MPGFHEAPLHTAQDRKVRLIGDGPRQPDCADHIAGIVQKLDARLARPFLAIEVRRVLFLDLGGIGKHDRQQVLRGRRTEDRSGKTLAHQIRQVAAVIDVGMTQHDRIDGRGRKRKLTVTAPRLGTRTLKQTAVQQNALAPRLDEVHGTRHRPGGAPKRDLRMGSIVGHGSCIRCVGGSVVPRAESRGACLSLLPVSLPVIVTRGLRLVFRQQVRSDPLRE